MTDSPLDSWDMELSFPAGTEVFNSWTITREGTNPVVFSNQTNQKLAPGESNDHHFGFQVNHNGNAFTHPTVTRCGDPIEPVESPMVLGIDSNRSYGVTSTEFNFSPKPLMPSLINGSTSFLWELSDGRTFTTENINVVFSTKGQYFVSLTVTNQAESYKATIPVLVYGLSDRSVGLPLAPALVGDVNQDGALTLADAHLIAKFKGRLQSLTPNPQQLSADINFDGKVDKEDLDLLTEALIDGNLLPDKLLSESGYRGSLVTIISPEMLNAADLIEVQVADTPRQSIAGTYLGYANAIIPLRIPESDSVQQVPIKLFRNNVLVRTYLYNINPSIALSINPVNEAVDLIEQIRELLIINESQLTGLFNSHNLQANDLDVLNGIASAGLSKASEALDTMESLLSGPSGEALAIAFLRAANANGLSDARVEIQSLIQSQSSILPQSGVVGRSNSNVFSKNSLSFNSYAISPDYVCDELLPALCALKFSSSVLETTSTWLGRSCDALLVAAAAALIVPADGPIVDTALISTWLTACSTVEFSIDVASILTLLLSNIDSDLRFDVSTQTPSAITPAILTTKLEVFGVDDICSIAVNNGFDKFAEKIAQQATHQIIRRKAALSTIAYIFQMFGEESLQMFFEMIEGSMARVVKESEIDIALKNLAEPYCDDLMGADLIINTSRVLTGPNPNNGILTFLSNGTAEYLCPEEQSSQTDPNVTITAALDICGKMATIERELSCSSKPLTISMGDNGSALDDIYEVVVNGTAVLSSNSPVRSKSITLQLTAGSTNTILMLGRAAPDGIGTYFINFSGAASISGSNTSGSDLTPGVVKVFFVTMPN